MRTVSYSVLCSLIWCLSAAQQKDNSTSNIFVKTLEACHRNESSFDPCIRKAANSLRSQFKNGIPELNIPPFDPFFIKEVSTTRGGSGSNIKLVLKNVYERGWTLSKVTAFKSDIPGRNLQYFQFFPEKYLDGDYDIKSNLIAPINNEGKFSLSLYNYTQVTTVRWTGPGKPFKVNIKALDSGDLKLHITNLAGGRVLIENIMDRIINVAWRPGFNMLKPIIDDLVSTAFTKLFNDALKTVPIEKIIPE